MFRRPAPGRTCDGYGAWISCISTSIRSAIFCAGSRSWAMVQSAAYPCVTSLGRACPLQVRQTACLRPGGPRRVGGGTEISNHRRDAMVLTGARPCRDPNRRESRQVRERVEPLGIRVAPRRRRSTSQPAFQDEDSSAQAVSGAACSLAACGGTRRRLPIPAAVPLPAEREANDHTEQYERQYQDDISDKFQRLSLRIRPGSLLYKPSYLCARLSSSMGSTLYISYGPPSVSCVRGAGRRIQASGRCGPDDIAPPPGQSLKRPHQRLLGFREILERTESMRSRARQRMVIARQREYKRRNEKRTDSADM